MARKKQSQEVGINMTPMIDIVFQLITFFLLVSQFASAEIDPRVVLPDLQDSAAIPRQPQVRKLVINLMAYQGSTDDKPGKELDYIKLGSLNITREARDTGRDEHEVLREQLEVQRDLMEAEDARLIIVLRAHKSLAWEHVQSVMLTAARLQIQDVRLAAPLGEMGAAMLGE